MRTNRPLVPLFAITLTAAVTLAVCGDSDQQVRGDDRPPVTIPISDGRVDPETGDTDVDDAGGIRPVDEAPTPANGTLSGRVLGVDRDGPSVEVVTARVVHGQEATEAARLAGDIGADEVWELDFYVVEGDTRWIDLDRAAAVTVYDCTAACEQVGGSLEHVLTGAPYGGTSAIWTFTVDDGRVVAVDEVYLP